MEQPKTQPQKVPPHARRAQMPPASFAGPPRVSKKAESTPCGIQGQRVEARRSIRPLRLVRLASIGDWPAERAYQAHDFAAEAGGGRKSSLPIKPTLKRLAEAACRAHAPTLRRPLPGPSYYPRSTFGSAMDICQRGSHSSGINRRLRSTFGKRRPGWEENVRTFQLASAPPSRTSSSPKNTRLDGFSQSRDALHPPLKGRSRPGHPNSLFHHAATRVPRAQKTVSFGREKTCRPGSIVKSVRAPPGFRGKPAQGS